MTSELTRIGSFVLAFWMFIQSWVRGDMAKLNFESFVKLLEIVYNVFDQG